MINETDIVDIDNDRDIVEELLKKVSEYLESESLVKIKNRITDYAEPITEGKLSGIINYNYQLASNQVSEVRNLLVESGVISVIHTLAVKGNRDMENEYISNLFSDSRAPQNISSYISIRTALENRLSHQLQQYNMNMAKNNSTSAISINELKGHVRTFRELSKSSITISTKAQHGIISASLHDAYITIINRADWRNDRSYMKFFFNEEDVHKSESLILSKKERQPLDRINANFEEIIDKFTRLKSNRILSQQKPDDEKRDISHQRSESSKRFSDKMILTPFGKQYGERIDTILSDIFTGQTDLSEEDFQKNFRILFETFVKSPDLLPGSQEIVTTCTYLINGELSLKNAAERYLLSSSRESFSKPYSESNKGLIDSFYNRIFRLYFDNRFESIFRIIKSLNMKKHACAYIIKRIYFLYGESVHHFGFYFLQTIANIGGIRQAEG